MRGAGAALASVQFRASDPAAGTGVRCTILLMLCLCAVLAACGSRPHNDIQPEVGVITDGTYRYAPLGWRMRLPWRWDVLTAGQLQALLGKGRALVEKAAGGEVVDSETHLLYLRHGAQNQFSSSVSPHDPAMGSMPEQIAATFDIILAACEAGNMRAQSTRGSEQIDGIRFDTLQVSILDALGKREILKQDVYVGRVGSHVLMTSITTTNWILRQQMLHTWRGSRFTPTRDVSQPKRS
jgi:hypothetical protein